ncbi:hypothetical protein D3C72_2416480 [compost metagenome]
MPVLDGDPQANALDHPLQPHRVVALGRADHAPRGHAVLVGQGQHDVAVQPFQAEIDPVFGLEGVGQNLERVVHGLSPG